MVKGPAQQAQQNPKPSFWTGLKNQFQPALGSSGPGKTQSHGNSAAQNQANLGQNNAANNSHGFANTSFVPSAISPIGSPTPTAVLTASNLFKQLVKAAKTYDVQKLKYVDKPKLRRTTFLD